ncbi:3-oxoacyl-acyl carrier reductase protein [Rutstroemia sp. NJR-2017a BBW]|nr:3-oxoacyl-acyl carrier reductase protein [Rutstroemia sp. NJR-2017a BBW]
MHPLLLRSCRGVSPFPFCFSFRVKSTAWLGLRRESTTAPASTSRYANTELPFAGKTIMVTGATKGIGRAIARRFAGLGGRLVLVGRDGEGLRGVREGMGEGERAREGEEEGIGHEILVGDVGDLEGFWRGEVARLGLGGGVAGGKGKEKVGALLLTHGLLPSWYAAFNARSYYRLPKPQIDILVNAAGITHSSPLITTSPDLIESVLHTNLQGTIWGCKVVSRMMVRRREGCIINVSSLLGMKGGRGSAAYAASKAGVLGLTRALAAELGPSGIRVNAIVPGYIETDMTKAMPTAARTEALNAIPLSRFGDVEEIADAAVFLATNRYANNCVLNLDGGLSAV